MRNDLSKKAKCQMEPKKNFNLCCFAVQQAREKQQNESMCVCVCVCSVTWFLPPLFLLPLNRDRRRNTVYEIFIEINI